MNIDVRKIRLIREFFKGTVWSYGKTELKWNCWACLGFIMRRVIFKNILSYPSIYFRPFYKYVMQELLTCKEYWLLNLCSFQNRWAQNTQNSEEEKKTQENEFRRCTINWRGVKIINHDAACMATMHTVKKACHFLVPSQDITNQTLAGRE